MLYSELRKKEVINMRDCKKLGHIVDIDIDERNGCIRRIKVTEKSHCLRCLPECCNFICKAPDYIIPYNEIKQIGPDIIVVDIC